MIEELPCNTTQNLFCAQAKNISCAISTDSSPSAIITEPNVFIERKFHNSPINLPGMGFK